jgi:charged multivesicular body protein 5
MNRLFGSKKEEVKPQPAPVPVKKVEQPPVDLTGQTKKLEVRIQEINNNVANVDVELKQLYPKMKAAKGTQQTFYKQRIINLMKKRKMYQQQVDSFLGQQLTLERVSFTNETIQNTIETSKALKEAVKAQQIQMQDLDLDELADIRDDMAEMAFENQQISELLSQNVYDCDANEDDLDAELKALDDEIYMEQLSKPSANKSEKVSMTNSTQSNKNSDIYADLLGKVNNAN